MAGRRQLALDDLLTRIGQASREVVGARYAALGVLDASRTRLASISRDAPVNDGSADSARLTLASVPRDR